MNPIMTADVINQIAEILGIDVSSMDKLVITLESGKPVRLETHQVPKRPSVLKYIGV